jgi:hypothetical protein
MYVRVVEVMMYWGGEGGTTRLSRCLELMVGE